MTGRVTIILAISAATLIFAGCTQKTPGSGGGGTGKPPTAGTTQKIHLVWKNSTNEWKVQLRDGGPEEDPKTATTHIGRDVGPTQFEIDIQGPTSATFKDSGALDVWEGVGKKSQPQSGLNSPQILGPSFSKDGKKLIFWNLNEGNPVTLNYRINFDTGPSVDPIIDNGGGNWN